MGKTNASERTEFYRKALDEQRHLLRTAIGGMATGDLAQALHIATTIRVLIHETAASNPFSNISTAVIWKCRFSTGLSGPRQRLPRECGR